MNERNNMQIQLNPNKENANVTGNFPILKNCSAKQFVSTKRKINKPRMFLTIFFPSIVMTWERGVSGSSRAKKEFELKAYELELKRNMANANT